MNPIRAVIIDDDRYVEKIARPALEQDFDVSCCQSGLDGIRLVESVEPHLILLDICLPDIEGTKLVPILRAFPFAAEMMIIAVTSSYEEGRLLAAGCDLYLQKPVNYSEIADHYRAFLNGPNGAA